MDVIDRNAVIVSSRNPVFLAGIGVSESDIGLCSLVIYFDNGIESSDCRLIVLLGKVFVALLQFFLYEKVGAFFFYNR